MSTNNDGWILMSERKPTWAELPVWGYNANADNTMDKGPATFLVTVPHASRWTHWKPAADIPAPPREKTQYDKDEAAFIAWMPDFAAYGTIAQRSWHAALAYERAEVAKLLPDIHGTEFPKVSGGLYVQAVRDIRARCGGGK